jgi:hypothetical protein
MKIAALVGSAGHGGDTFLAGGGRATGVLIGSQTSAGGNGLYGSGGGGSASSNTTAVTGGNGGAGVVRITEFK